jgi:nicotinamidase-related amidase
MKLRETKPVLICVDLQQGFLDEESWGGNRNNKDAEEVCAKIISYWRTHNEKIIHVRHSSKDVKSKLHANRGGFKFNPLCKPIKDETVLTKSVNSCFIGTNLKEILDQVNCSTVVIVGLTTDHCVSTTTRMASNYGYNTYLVSDATATFNKVWKDGEIFDSKLMHNTALASLNDEFAKVVTSNKLFQIY